MPSQAHVCKRCVTKTFRSVQNLYNTTKSSQSSYACRPALCFASNGSRSWERTDHYTTIPYADYSTVAVYCRRGEGMQRTSAGTRYTVCTGHVGVWRACTRCIICMKGYNVQCSGSVSVTGWLGVAASTSVAVLSVPIPIVCLYQELVCVLLS